MNNKNIADEKYQPDFYEGYDDDVKQLNYNINMESLRCKRYNGEIANELKNLGRDFIVGQSCVKSYRIPFKVRWNRLVNKLSNIFR